MISAVEARARARRVVGQARDGPLDAAPLLPLHPRPLRLVHPCPGEVPEVRPLHAHLIQNTLVQNSLRVPALAQAEISGAFVDAVGVLGELVPAGGLEVSEEGERA